MTHTADPDADGTIEADGEATGSLAFGAGDSMLLAGPGGLHARGTGRVFFAGC